MALFPLKPKVKNDKKTKKKKELTIPDIIAPAGLEIEQNYLKLENKFIRTYFIISYPESLNTGWLSPIINIDQMTDVSIFIHPVNTGLVLRKLRKKLAEVQAQIMEKEEKGLVRDPLLEAAYRNIEDLRDKLTQAREKIFNFGLYITIYGERLEELDKIESRIRSILETEMIYMKPALFRQKEGLNSSLPFLLDQLDISSPMNSSPLSTSFPFVSFDLTSNEGILYGLNRHNNSLVLFDRFSLENANTVIFGKSGSGKSYSVKLEVLRSLMLGIDVIIIDPENEYQYLAETCGGSFFKISLTSKHHINPFDLPLVGEDETPEDILRSNIINLIGLLRIMLGGLSPEEDAIIDKAVTETYASRDITPESDFSKITPPLMKDLGTILEHTEGGESLSTRLKKYTEGTYAGFLNNYTNVDMGAKLVVFNIRDMEKELRPIAMYIILHYIWNTIKSELKKRILIVDEAWWLMQHDDGASFLYGLAKRARKYYLGLTTITQDVNDFMKSTYGQPIISNSSLQLLLKQSPATIDIVKQTFNLTDQEKYLLLESDVGDGLFFAGLKHVAIKVVASYTEDQVITSDPEQLLAIKKAKEELAKEELTKE